MSFQELDSMAVIEKKTQKYIIFEDSSVLFHETARHFFHIAKNAIQERGIFTVALSGGSTPKKLFEIIATSPEYTSLNWDKVLFFWSDERSVPYHDKESNFGQALTYLEKITPLHAFGMPAYREDRDQAAVEYDALIKKTCSNAIFDLMYLGMGEDGHTASLFPNTRALHEKNALVVANWVPEKTTWRMTCTYPCINSSRVIVLLASGASKQDMLLHVFEGKEPKVPVQDVGVENSPCLFFLDQDAGKKILSCMYSV